jgi:hypothetical protein
MLCSIVAALGACSHPAPAQHHESAGRVPYGTAMADVARRFELLGRAVAASRYELADYELDEIAEQFTGVLRHAAPPREGHPEVLAPLEKDFLQKALPDLGQALSTRDPGQAAAAFGRTATACNDCHHASGHAFIEVPVVAGHSVPRTDPVPP